MNDQITRIKGIPTDNIIAFCGGPVITSTLYVCTKPLLDNLISDTLLTTGAIGLGILFTATTLHNRPLKLKYINMTIRTIHGLAFSSCSAFMSLLFLTIIKGVKS